MAQTARPLIQAPPVRAMLTATEVASLLGCHRNQVADMRERGTLPFKQWGDRTYRYPRAAVEAYLRGERSDGGIAGASAQPAPPTTGLGLTPAQCEELAAAFDLIARVLRTAAGAHPTR